MVFIMAKNNSSNFDILIPDDYGPFSRTAPMSGGDLTDVSDNIKGQLQSIFYRSQLNGLPVEISRYRNPSPSTVGVSVVESAANFLIGFIDRDCTLVVQRRRKTDGMVQHYGRFQLNTITRSNTTAQGINPTDSVSLVTMPGTFGSYHEFTCFGPQPTIPVEGDELEFIPVGMTFCDCLDCCDLTDGCQRVYALYKDNTDSSIVLKTSGDCGVSWSELSPNIPNGTVPTSLHCYQGRLFIGTVADNPLSPDHIEVWFSDDPLSDAWVSADTSDVYDPIVGLVQVTAFAHWGKIIYLLMERDIDGPTVIWTVARSIDYGQTWQLSFNTTPQGTGFKIHDLATSGRQVVITGDNGAYILSTSYGDPGTWVQNPIVASGLSKFPGQPDTQTIPVSIMAMALWQPDFRNLGCTVVMAVDIQMRVFVTSDNENWQLVWEDCLIGPSATNVTIETAADGWLLWIHARLSDGRILTIKNLGDNCWRTFYDQVGFENSVIDCSTASGDLVITVTNPCNIKGGDTVTIILTDLTPVDCVVKGVIGNQITMDSCPPFTAEEICAEGVIDIICGDRPETTIFAICNETPDKALWAKGAFE